MKTLRPGGFECPKCGGNKFGTSNCTSPFEEWKGHCHNCNFEWDRKKDDDKYFYEVFVTATQCSDDHIDVLAEEKTVVTIFKKDGKDTHTIELEEGDWVAIQRDLRK